MNFKNAEKLLREGKKIRRKNWQASLYLQIDALGNIKGFREEAISFNYDLTIINSHDWVIIGEDDNIISFAEALDALLHGKLVKLKEWPIDCFLEKTSNGKEVFMRRTCEYDFIPTFECFLSTDWEEIE